MRVVALAGGIGGARLVDGLRRVLPEDALTVVVNTGDDFEHWGLHISPDLDTIMYTLAGRAPEERGWGIEGDTFGTLQAVKKFGGQSWFQLGDQDLATHLLRTKALRNKRTLTDVTRHLCEGLGVRTPVVPMTDERRPTMIHTKDGRTLAFQHWLVKERTEPRVSHVSFVGAPVPSKRALHALQEADLVILCPSNPYVSVDPILALNQIRNALDETLCVGVSPIVNGKAVKGPLATMIVDLAHCAPTAAAVAAHYAPFLSGFVVHHGDNEGLAVPALESGIVMRSVEERTRLAQTVVDFAETLR